RITPGSRRSPGATECEHTRGGSFTRAAHVGQCDAPRSRGHTPPPGGAPEETGGQVVGGRAASEFAAGTSTVGHRGGGGNKTATRLRDLLRRGAEKHGAAGNPRPGVPDRGWRGSLLRDGQVHRQAPAGGDGAGERPERRGAARGNDVEGEARPHREGRAERV